MLTNFRLSVLFPSNLQLIKAMPNQSMKARPQRNLLSKFIFVEWSVLSPA